MQYDAARLITGARKGTQRARVYDEIALKTLSTRRHNRKLVIFHSIVNNLKTC